MGVAPRRLWGWEPVETTEVFDAAGVLLSRTVTTREPEFDEAQRSLLLAHLALESERGDYGELISEAVSPDADPSNPERKYHYVADNMPTINFAAKAVMDKQDAYYKQYPDASRNGHVWPVRKANG